MPLRASGWPRRAFASSPRGLARVRTLRRRPAGVAEALSPPWRRGATRSASCILTGPLGSGAVLPNRGAERFAGRGSDASWARGVSEPRFPAFQTRGIHQVRAGGGVAVRAFRLVLKTDLSHFLLVFHYPGFIFFRIFSHLLIFT